MKILAIDRSTDTQSVALAIDGEVKGRVFAGMDSRSAEWPVKIRDFLSANGLSPRDLDQVLVGQGPGSFAGIRAALAFAQGIALGNPLVNYIYDRCGSYAPAPYGLCCVAAASLAMYFWCESQAKKLQNACTNDQ